MKTENVLIATGAIVGALWAYKHGKLGVPQFAAWYVILFAAGGWALYNAVEFTKRPPVINA